MNIPDRAQLAAWTNGARADASSRLRWLQTQAHSGLRRWLDLPAEYSRALNDPQLLLRQARAALRGHLRLVFTFSAAINLLYLAPSIYMMQVYDRVLPTGGVLTLVLLSVVLLTSLAVMAGLDALRTRLLARASLRVERMAAEAILAQSMARRRGGTQVANGIRDLDTLRAGLTSPAAVGVLDLPWMPIYVIVGFMLHPWIGVLALAGAAVIFALAILNDRALRASMSDYNARAPLFYLSHESDLQAAETIHALGAQSTVIGRRQRSRAELVEAQNVIAFRNAAFAAGTKATRLMLQSAALGLGCYLAINREMSPGAIIAASILTARAYAPIEQIVGGWRQLAQALQSYVALNGLLQGADGLAERTPLPAPLGRIRVEQASAAPAGSKVPSIQGVSFAVEPGQLVGIVGESGAGKSTLARVLANAAPTLQGDVRIDGARYRDWDAAALSRHIGYLPQRVDLFDGTVADNISCLARERGESMDEVGRKVVAAAMAAGAHELILQLPRGYETALGLGGSGVSPGQAQRIALARALYDEPKVLVLDEPNAHLDAEGEQALVRALQAHKGRGGVAFVVAHRAGVIGVADLLAVVSAGRLVEFGPRDEVQAKLAQTPRSRSNVVQMRGEAVAQTGART